MLFSEAYFENVHFGFERSLEDILEGLEEGEPEQVCENCQRQFEQFGVYDGLDCYFCEPCAIRISQEHFREAILKANEECRIIQEFPTFDPTKKWTCTQEEYKSGFRESYTENAYRTFCRHRFTNYDDLISGLDRDSMYDRARYNAIRSTIDKLIDSEIESKDLIRCDFEEDEPEEV